MYIIAKAAYVLRGPQDVTGLRILLVEDRRSETESKPQASLSAKYKKREESCRQYEVPAKFVVHGDARAVQDEEASIM